MNPRSRKPPRGKSPSCCNTPCAEGVYGLLHCQQCKPYAVAYLEWHAADAERKRIIEWVRSELDRICEVSAAERRFVGDLLGDIIEGLEKGVALE